MNPPFNKHPSPLLSALVAAAPAPSPAPASLFSLLKTLPLLSHRPRGVVLVFSIHDIETSAYLFCILLRLCCRKSAILFTISRLVCAQTCILHVQRPGSTNSTNAPPPTAYESLTMDCRCWVLLGGRRRKRKRKRGGRWGLVICPNVTVFGCRNAGHNTCAAFKSVCARGTDNDTVKRFKNISLPP